MSFDVPVGTRGARQPRAGMMMRFVNNMAAGRIRRSGKMMGFSAAHPDQVRIEVDGRTIPVTAEQLHGPERDEAWQEIVAAAPRFAGCQQKTDRQLPVILLTERAG